MLISGIKTGRIYSFLHKKNQRKASKEISPKMKASKEIQNSDDPTTPNTTSDVCSWPTNYNSRSYMQLDLPENYKDNMLKTERLQDLRFRFNEDKRVKSVPTSCTEPSHLPATKGFPRRDHHIL